MSVDEVEALLQTPKMTSAFGVRDKAMLELLYATGLRVSELIALNLEDVHLTMGFVRCVGKGNKERIIPLGSLATEAIQKYIEKGRRELMGKSSRCTLFKPSWKSIIKTRILEDFKTISERSKY